MVLETPRSEVAAYALARKAAKALGLRVAAIDMFTEYRPAIPRRSRSSR